MVSGSVLHVAHEQLSIASVRDVETKGMRIYVGNLSYDTTREDLEQSFGEHGQVSDVHVPMDRETGRPRGFAFVEMPDDAAAKAAIDAFNGAELGGRTLTVNQARERTERPRGGGGGGGGGRW